MRFRSIITNQIANSGFLLTASYALMPVVLAKEEQEPKLVRPRDLPIYPEESKGKKIEKENWEPTVALGSIQKVREEIVNLNQKWSKVKVTAYSHTESFVEDLRQEKNFALRAGFVAGGGLVGLLVAAKKGKFKKLIFTTTGATAAFYVGYPKEYEEATNTIRRYYHFSHHFLINVIKDLTGIDLLLFPKPKGEPDVDNSGEVKPELIELFYSLVDCAKEQLESLKKFVFNEKIGPAEKDK